MPGKRKRPVDTSWAPLFWEPPLPGRPPGRAAVCPTESSESWTPAGATHRARPRLSGTRRQYRELGDSPALCELVAAAASTTMHGRGRQGSALSARSTPARMRQGRRACACRVRSALLPAPCPPRACAKAVCRRLRPSAGRGGASSLASPLPAPLGGCRTSLGSLGARSSQPSADRPRARRGPGFAPSGLTAVCRSAQSPRSEGTTSPKGHWVRGGAGIGARSGAASSPPPPEPIPRSPAPLTPDELRGASPRRRGRGPGGAGGRAGGPGAADENPGLRKESGQGQGSGKEKRNSEGKRPGLVGRDGGLPAPTVHGRVELLLLPGARVPEHSSQSRPRSRLCARASTRSSPGAERSSSSQEAMRPNYQS